MILPHFPSQGMWFVQFLYFEPPQCDDFKIYDTVKFNPNPAHPKLILAKIKP